MNSEQKRVAVTTLGCKTNQFESAAMIESLEQSGFAVVPFEEPAEFYVINTCTVTARTDAESRKLVRRAKRRNPAARIIVTGCYAQVAPEQLSAMAEVELVIGNEEKRRLPELLTAAGTPQRVLVSDIGGLSETAGLQLSSFSEHTRAFLQIQNGCDSFCSYCIVPYARGRSRSVAAEEVLDGVARLAAEGFREIVLTGIHLGCYGRDLSPPNSLLRLLQKIEKQRAVERLRLGSLEPQDITPELLDFIAASGLIAPHLHLPLQSGSDAVLSRMNRRYGGSGFRDLCLRAVARVPDLCLGFDVIAGFPGETVADFSATVQLIEDLPVAYLHVFPFSSRPGTAAAAMPGHLQSSVVTARAEQLRNLGERKKLQYQSRFAGRTLEALVLQRSGDRLWHGLTPNYLSVCFESDEDLGNRIVPVRVTWVRNGAIMAELLQ
ncbi:threonylcarbamoyladenosine tRNA methylthiotransferase MtaB [Geobacter sp. OR-1]|uniref:tRNA (N(6)-L-threonylcarbamoyladenosine(37)-C(2))- methylthiotransferase MtaB n=1 Tax=Geobacter sp. OR-1 TaxID=1266765 RepID=UPI000543212C|nr:tRNA (N(6)-L-threonylcarbamoyladenosine(37)-C(2))-methylthiotransferase MtaB [Geobacter sp. OR-1]GAM07974.1 threonylcarbamoyladenosine tRNA methylthiotransferase MtaB [Geobacter sp. OR-1]